MLTRRQMLQLAAACACTPLIRLSATDDPAPKIKKLVLIHGRAQQGRDPAKVKTEWLDALKRGATAQGLSLPGDVEIALPFYGDTLDSFARQFEIPLASEIQSRGAVQDEFLAFQEQFAEAIRTRSGVTDAQVDAEYGNDPQPRGPLNWKWVQAILRAIDKNGGGLSQSAIEAFTRDVFLYTTRAGVRDAIDAIVAASLTEAPTVVVSHSLGTIVAYSVLLRDTRALQVPLLVTVGSPLGVRAVRDQFRPLKSPRPVKAWYNAYDTRDVVSLYGLDKDSFPIAPPVENYPGVKNHTDNRHSIEGYLDDPFVAKRIVSALKG